MESNIKKCDANRNKVEAYKGRVKTVACNYRRLKLIRNLERKLFPFTLNLKPDAAASFEASSRAPKWRLRLLK